jgi:hypothetical protein
MGNARNLSFSTGFNQQKIIINSSQAVTCPALSFTPDTLFTVSTGQTVRPTARVFVEIGGILAPAYASTAASQNSLGKAVAFLCYFDGSNNLVVQSFSNEATTTAARVYYRIYKDGRPS